MEHNYVVVDVETGGLDASKHSLLEVAFIYIKEGKEVGRYGALVKSNEYIVTPEAMAVNKIDLAKAKKNGMSLEDIAEDVMSDIKWYFRGCKTKPMFLGFNVEFDKQFINGQLLTAQNLTNLMHYKSVDVFSIGHFLVTALNLNPPTTRLSGFMELFGLGNEESEGRHTAMYDAEMAWKVYNHFIALIQDMDSRANQ